MELSPRDRVAFAGAVVDRGRVHSRALDGFALSRREAVGHWRPRADKECFFGEGAREPVTRAKGYLERAKERPYLLIRPDPRCPECIAIMDWRSAHRWIDITDGAEIKLSDNPWGSRHGHMRDVQAAHHKVRVELQLTEWEREERWHPVA